MHLKKILMVGVMGMMMGWSSSSFSMPCNLAMSVGGICFFQDVITAIANYALLKSEEKLLNPIYNVHNGLEEIKKNIGMYQDKGICGRSATGQTGCDLVSAEEGAAMAAATAGMTPALLEGASAMMKSANLTERLEANGDITLDREQFGEDYLRAIGLSEGANTFDRVRANVVAHVFETDVEAINRSCTCSVSTEGGCDAKECAEQRQNELLITSSTAASANADGYLRDIEKRNAELRSFVEEVNSSSDTVADYLGNLGYLSAYASTVAIEQMVIQTYDLRTQSYRALVFGGTKKEDAVADQLGGGN